MIKLAPIVMTMAFAFGTPDPSVCPEKPDNPPAIRVDVDIDQPKIDHSLPRAQLKRFDIANTSPYGNGDNVHVNGLMRGSISLQTEMALAWQRNEDASINCTWYDNVGIKLTLKPTIYVAREILTDSCMYREVLNHEYKHYKTDYDIAKDYQVIMQDELDRYLKQAGVVGPYTKEQQEQVKNDMTVRLERMIHSINDRMKFDRIKRQGLIDTRAEYERVAAACKSEIGSM